MALRWKWVGTLVLCLMMEKIVAEAVDEIKTPAPVAAETTEETIPDKNKKIPHKNGNSLCFSIQDHRFVVHYLDKDGKIVPPPWDHLHLKYRKTMVHHKPKTLSPGNLPKNQEQHKAMEKAGMNVYNIDPKTLPTAQAQTKQTLEQFQQERAKWQKEYIKNEIQGPTLPPNFSIPPNIGDITKPQPTEEIRKEWIEKQKGLFPTSGPVIPPDNLAPKKISPGTVTLYRSGRSLRSKYRIYPPYHFHIQLQWPDGGGESFHFPPGEKQSSAKKGSLPTR
ncbi:MAG: hypothetical protein LBR62_01750 [Puniceicoccales bacterium]|jgi:hypothetical protein|nr:hypothetical protein [Puniceicoccales bacterium]